MKLAAKISIMVVRLAFVAGLLLGVSIWLGKLIFLSWHIQLGFVLAAAVLVLAGIGLAKRLVPVGVVGLVVAVLLPVSGLMQIAYKGLPLPVMQIIHVVLALGVMGVAEALNGRIQRSA